MWLVFVLYSIPSIYLAAKLRDSPAASRSSPDDEEEAVELLRRKSADDSGEFDPYDGGDLAGRSDLRGGKTENAAGEVAAESGITPMRRSSIV